MNDLEHGNVLFPRDAHASRGLEVIPVHYDMDHEVEDYRDPRDGGQTNQLSVAEECGSTVMVGVEEGWNEG